MEGCRKYKAVRLFVVSSALLPTSFSRTTLLTHTKLARGARTQGGDGGATGGLNQGGAVAQELTDMYAKSEECDSRVRSLFPTAQTPRPLARVRENRIQTFLAGPGCGPRLLRCSETSRGTRYSPLVAQTLAAPDT